MENKAKNTTSNGTSPEAPQISGQLLSYLDSFLANPTKQTLLVFAMGYSSHACILEALARPNKIAMLRARRFPCVQCPMHSAKNISCPRNRLLDQWTEMPGRIVLKLTELRALKEILADETLIVGLRPGYGVESVTVETNDTPPTEASSDPLEEKK